MSPQKDNESVHRLRHFRVIIADAHPHGSQAGPTEEDLQDVIKEWYEDHAEEFVRVEVIFEDTSGEVVA